MAQSIEDYQREGLSTTNFMRLFSECVKLVDPLKIEQMAGCLAGVRNRNGRLFIIGVGGGAGNAMHAAADFINLCEIRAYAPVANVPEFTARVNDNGWDNVFIDMLRFECFKQQDALMVFSVGGGNVEKNVSVNIARAVDYAGEYCQADVLGVVGRDDGTTATKGHHVIVCPMPKGAPDALLTPFTESLQVAVWHCLVSHPALKYNKTKW